MSQMTGHALDTSREPALRVIMLPKDTNGAGTIFGGVILSYIDMAGAVEARRHCNAMFVTVAMREVEFKKPVFVGDIVSFYTETKHVGNSSVTVGVQVEAIRRFGIEDEEQVRVTEGEVIYVATDTEGKKIIIKECQQK